MSEGARKNPVVVSVINLKGGVGKTTVAALLARYAAGMSLSVLAVDLDPQANLSQALMTEYDYKQFMDNEEPSIVELFNGYRAPSRERLSPAPLGQVRRKVGYRENLHLIPSRFDFSDNLLSSVRVDERALAKYIANNEMRDNDLILIDCAPTESVLTRAAYHASRYVLVPVRLEFFSTIGFPLLRESLKNFKSDNSGHAIDVCRVLINKPPRGVDQWEARKEILEQAKKYEWTIMDNEMSYSTGYPKLMRNEYANWPGNALEEFSKIADEFMKVTRLSPQGE